MSFGQACAKSIAAWLGAALTPDVQVLDHWPVNSNELTVNSYGRIKTVTVTKIGRRRREDCLIPLQPLAMQMVSESTARAVFPVGSFVQPMQLDVWTAYDPDREDLVTQVDAAMTAGVDQTIGGGATDNPVRDGIVLALSPLDGYVGFIDCWFDEPDLDDTPATIQRAEFRATYLGEVRGTFARVATTPVLQNAVLNLDIGE